MLYYPVELTRLSATNQRSADCMAALRVFAAPVGLVTYDTGDSRFASYSAMKAGAIALSGEFGGAGLFSIEGYGIIDRGVRSLLAHFGVAELPAADVGGNERRSAESRIMEVPDDRFTVWSDANGLFQPSSRWAIRSRRGRSPV